MSEELHRALFEFHGMVFQGAWPKLNEALRLLNTAKENADNRPKLTVAYQKLERVREMLEEAGLLASEARNETIRSLGCDGSCTKPADTEHSA